MKMYKRDMKKLALFFVAAFAACAVSAQDCERIVMPKYGNDAYSFSNVPLSKVDFHCRWSRNCFYVVDEIPAESKVYDIEQLVSFITGQHLTKNFVVDLDELSFYEYDFSNYQETMAGNTVFFYTPKSSHKYLALRSYQDVSTITGDANEDLDNVDREHYLNTLKNEINKDKE